MLKRSRWGAVLSIIAASLLAMPSVEAAPYHVDDHSEREVILDVLVGRGVALEKANELADRILEGELVDADRPEAKPLEVQIDSKTGISRLVFADGSIALSGLAADEVGTIRPGGISRDVAPTGAGARNCSYAGGSGWSSYTNCTIFYDGISYSYSFRASFTVSKAGSSIQRAWDPTVHRCVAAICTERTLHIDRQRSIGTTPAVARMTFQHQGYVGGSPANTKTLKLYLRVYTTSYKVEPA